MCPGQLAKATTRVPPSYSEPLPSRYGPLSQGILIFDTSPSPANIGLLRAAVVALEDDQRVVAHAASCQCRTTRPIWSSMAVTIAA